MSENSGSAAGLPAHSGRAAEVFSAFLRLGLTSFGGPIAHLGYFREEFVERAANGSTSAPMPTSSRCASSCPGPASSQIGFAIGLMRAGYAGALAAWTGFTLPSAIALVLFAYGADALERHRPAPDCCTASSSSPSRSWRRRLGHGAHASPRIASARPSPSLAALIILFSASSSAQIGAIVLGGIAGLWLCRSTAARSPRGHMPIAGVARRAARGARAVFRAPRRTAAPARRRLPQGVALFEAFYRSGALVFGGGHVVLPLLRDAVVTPGWVSDDAFLAGYGAAQAVPGPLFTFAAYLGTIVHALADGIAGAALGAGRRSSCPAFLLLMGTLPFWDTLRQRSGAQAAMRGVNAAVVGLLAAALYNPVWTTTVGSTPRISPSRWWASFCSTVWRAPPLLVVGLGALSGMALALLP